jgi:hypothetical protein
VVLEDVDPARRRRGAEPFEDLVDPRIHAVGIEQSTRRERRRVEDGALRPDRARLTNEQAAAEPH